MIIQAVGGVDVDMPKAPTDPSRGLAIGKSSLVIGMIAADLHDQRDLQRVRPGFTSALVATERRLAMQRAERRAA
jgi:hypothetical protein